MNCTGVKKFIYAFADNQLGVKESCEVLDHLKLCPGCSRLVDEHQTLRKAIVEQCQEVHAPAALRSRLLESVQSPAPAELAPIPGRRPGWQRLAAAACLLLAAGGVAWWGLPGGAGSGESPARVITPVPRGESAASMIAAVHFACCNHHEMHQSKSLPAHLGEVAPALRDHFDDTLAARAPDLSRYGFAFESVNLCGVRDKPGCEGGHIIYVNEREHRLSFFSVPRWDCLDKCGRAAGDPGGEFREYSVERESGPALQIVAWHEHATTYICCACVEPELLEDMVRDTRTAMAGFDRQVRLAAAGD